MSIHFTDSTTYGTTRWLYAYYTPATHRVQFRGELTLNQAINVNTGHYTVGYWKSTSPYNPIEQRVCLSNTGGAVVYIVFIEAASREVWLRVFNGSGITTLPSGNVITAQADYML